MQESVEFLCSVTLRSSFEDNIAVGIQKGGKLLPETIAFPTLQFCYAQRDINKDHVIKVKL